MELTISAVAESFPIAGKFTISRGSKTEAHVVTARVSDGRNTGLGECVPYGRYDETVGSVIEQIQSCAHFLTAVSGREEVHTRLPPGAARNALDCALWDFEAKSSGKSAAGILGLESAAPLTTAFTLSLGSPDEMAAAARAAADRPFLKIKVGGGGDIDRIRAVVQAAPGSRVIVDANEAWDEENLEANMREAAALGVVLIEQPLPQGRDAMLRHVAHPVPVCADESAHTSASLPALAGLYDAVNIKLDKTGGLTEAIRMRAAAKAMGFKIMVGCMVGTSLAMAPALLLAQGADFVDLDGPLLLARDRDPALRYEGSLVFPAARDLWG